VKGTNHRIRGLDFLRGFAIAVMFFDHLAAIAFLQGIELFNVRFFTRIAEPIFALLFGYFLFGRDKKRLALRLFEIGVVAVFVNIFFYPLTGVFDILVDFFAIGVLYILLGDSMRFLFPFVFLTPVFPGFLDYPFPLVLSQACIGMLARERAKVLFPALLLFLSSAVAIQTPLQYTVLFTFVAWFLLWIFSSHLRDFDLPPLNYIGKRPLLFYVIQYLIAIFAALVIPK
jgi:hypothetical protein